MKAKWESWSNGADGRSRKKIDFTRIVLLWNMSPSFYLSPGNSPVFYPLPHSLITLLYTPVLQVYFKYSGLCITMVNTYSVSTTDWVYQPESLECCYSGNLQHHFPPFPLFPGHIQRPPELVPQPYHFQGYLRHISGMLVTPCVVTFITLSIKKSIWLF